MSLDLKIIGEITNLAEKFQDIEKIVLFGSRARGDNKERSDIDLAIFAPNLDYYDFADFCEQLEEIETLLKFDVVQICFNTDRKLLENIEQEGVTLWERPK